MQIKLNSYQIKMVFFSCLILVDGLMVMDFINPSLPYMMHDLSASQSSMKGLMIAYMMSLGIAQLFHGPFSDNHGRKKTILLGLVIAIFGLFFSIISYNIVFLYFSRLLTAAGLASTAVISRALISDVCHDEYSMRKAFSFWAMFGQLSPSIAPLAGGIIQERWSWHVSFGVLFSINLIVFLVIALFMPESHQSSDKKSIFFEQVHILIELAKNKRFCLFSVLSALIFVFTIGFYSLSPFVFHEMKISASENGLLYIPFVLGMLLGAFSLSSILSQVKSEKLFFVGLFWYWLICFFFFIVFLFFKENILLIVVFSFMLSFNSGLMAPLSLNMCLEGFKANKGSASAAQGFVKMFLTGVSLLIFNFIEIKYFYALVCIFLIISSVMLSLYYFLFIKNTLREHAFLIE